MQMQVQRHARSSRSERTTRRHASALRRVSGTAPAARPCTPPTDAERVGGALRRPVLARVEVADRHEHQDREHDQRRDVEPARRAQGVEVEDDDVPVRREALEEVILGLGVELAEAVAAGEQRQGADEQPRPGRAGSARRGRPAPPARRRSSGSRRCRRAARRRSAATPA